MTGFEIRTSTDKGNFIIPGPSFCIAHTLSSVTTFHYIRKPLHTKLLYFTITLLWAEDQHRAGNVVVVIHAIQGSNNFSLTCELARN